MVMILTVFGLLAIIVLLAVYYSDKSQKQLYPDKNEISLTSKEWWAKKRTNYNRGLIIAGVAAFLAYAILGELLIAPYDNEFEVTLFTTFFQGLGYLLMILIANLFYNLGYYVDRNYNKNNSQVYRQKLFNLGFWFSVGLPFLIPIAIVVEYFIRFAKK